MRKLFDSSKKSKKSKIHHAPKKYRNYTYNDLYSMTDTELKTIQMNGTSLRNRDEARNILKEREKTRLVTYGY